MAADYAAVKSMVERGVGRGYTHCLIVVDEFDYEDYPVYIPECQDVQDMIVTTNALSMQRVIEVYNYSKDLEEQLRRDRCWEI